MQREEIFGIYEFWKDKSIVEKVEIESSTITHTEGIV